MDQSRFRHIVFTINNPSEAEYLAAKSLINHCKYVIAQLERGESGTLHVQGYASTGALGKRRALWVRLLGTRAFVERARGTPEQCRTYCSKQETRQPIPDGWSGAGGCSLFEEGEVPVNKGQGSRSDLVQAVEAVTVDRVSFRELISLHPEPAIKYVKGLQFARAIFAPKRCWKTRVIWCYGPTGSGKSYYCYGQAPDAYSKNPANKWWDGYDDQPDVIIDDFRKDFSTFHHLLNLFDRYPLSVEVKGGTVQFVARRIFVTAPQSWETMWEGYPEQLGQLGRRIDELRFFPNNGFRERGIEYQGEVKFYRPVDVGSVVDSILSSSKPADVSDFGILGELPSEPDEEGSEL